MFSNAKVGDRIWNVVQGWGEVIQIDNDPIYPLGIQFENGITEKFTLDGKGNRLDKYPCLYWDEIKIIPPPKPKREVKMKIYTQEELKEILKSHHEWLTTPGGICADLNGADLSGADLSGADLRGADLSDADLSYANLSDADLSGAVLSGADLRRANLSDADLNGADLSGADLSGADLRGADLSDANLSDADLSDADLSGANLRRADLRRANLSDADLSDANLSYADLSGADLSGANLSGAKGLLDPIKYIEKNFEKTEDGIIVYKSFGVHYTPNPNWEIAEGSIIEEVVNPLPTVACGCGVNVGTQKWVKENCNQPVWECLIKWEWLSGVVVPYQTDGKIRASKVQLIKQLD